MAVVAWPPPTFPNTTANTTAQLDAHALYHNRTADALDTVIGRLTPAPWAELASVVAKIGAPSGVTPAAGEQAVPALSGIAVTAVAGRRYRIRIDGRVTISIASGVASLTVKDGTTVLNRGLAYSVLAGFPYSCRVEWEGTLTAGAHTINVTFQNSSGSGTAGMDATDTTVMTIDQAGP